MAGVDVINNAAREEIRPQSKKDGMGGPLKPDAKAHQDKLAAATKAIEDIKEKLKEVRDKINAASGGKQEFNRRKQEIRENMDQIQVQIDTLEGERTTIIESMDEHRQSGQKIKTELNTMKKTLGYTSEEQINQKIREIENSMMISTMPLREEKKMLLQIQQLKSSKKLVEKYSLMEANAQNTDTVAIVPLKARLEQITEELKVLRNRKKNLSEKFKALLNERQIEAEPLKELFEERDKYRRAQEEQIARRRQHYDAYNAAMRQWQNHQNQIRAARNDRIREEKLKRAAEQQKIAIERQLEKMDALPFESEVLLLEQTIAYVKKLIDDRNSRNTGHNHDSNSAQWVADALKDHGEALLPKSLRHDEFAFTPKKLGAARKSIPNTNHIKKTAKPHIFKHDIGTLSYFEQCGVAAPVTEDDLEQCRDKLEERLAFHQAKQQDELEKHREKRKSLEAQLNAIDLTGKKKDNLPLSGAKQTSNYDYSSENISDS